MEDTTPQTDQPRSHHHRTTRTAPAVRAPVVWSIGGGKGGVGKSLVSSSLATSFARRGLRCAIVDMDLGSANQHTLLGMPAPRVTLSHFLSGEVANLGEALAETRVPNLWLAGATGASPQAANPKHFQKQKLIRHLRLLDVDHVFLDLGAGCAFNVLDFLLAADHPILVSATEPTSVENTYHFLKAAFFRWLGRVAKQSDVRETVARVLAESSGKRLGSPRELIEAVSAIDPAAGQSLAERARSFAAQLIVNKVRDARQREVGRKIADTCREDLGAQVDYSGSVAKDECVYDAVSNCRPVLEIAPNCAFSADIHAIAQRLIDEHGHGTKAAPPQIEPPEARWGEIPGRQPLATYALRDDHSTNPEPAPTSLSATAVTPAPRNLSPLGDARPGAHLRRCRETLGLSIGELSQTTRIFSLANIEDERYGLLPPNPYLRGLVLQYAQALGIAEAENVADAYIRCYRSQTPAAA
jgi:flagellar biosynthesis protein FlhG